MFAGTTGGTEKPISFADFQKLDIRVGKILFAEPVAGSSKLIKLRVDLGGDERTIVAGIAAEYSPEELAGKSIAVLANVESKTLMGIESQGMILAADVRGKAVLLHPGKSAPAGSQIK